MPRRAPPRREPRGVSRRPTPRRRRQEKQGVSRAGPVRARRPRVPRYSAARGPSKRLIVRSAPSETKEMSARTTDHLRTKFMSVVRVGIPVAILFVLANDGCVSKALPPGEALSQQERKDAIRRASVWSPTQIPSVDVRTGPKVEGAFAP